MGFAETETPTHNRSLACGEGTQCSRMGRSTISRATPFQDPNVAEDRGDVLGGLMQSKGDERGRPTAMTAKGCQL